MKKLCIFFVAVVTTAFAYGQALLNEIYPLPSNSNHEFFELYNTDTSQTPVSVDGYTLISYFEESGKKGFYVMDLPNLTMASKGYLVGASAIPFNYQGFTGSTKADFNWNDPVFRSGVTGGYLKKWYKSTSNLLDGNPNYDEEVLPLTFNDFFKKQGGNGASYNAFLYKDGILVNSFLGGTGGNTVIPTFITSMPSLNFTNINNSSTNTYTVSSASYSSVIAEFVTQDVGTDNGFIRKSDGMCGTWDKSSAQAFHTPQKTNGGSQMAVVGKLSINTHITRGISGESSFIVYNITSGRDFMFPVDLYIYADNGSVVGQWDANDVFLEGNVENAVSDGPFTTYFTPENQQLILVAKTAVGCYDQVLLVKNPDPPVVVLPITLKYFAGKQTGKQFLLEWVALNNGSGNHFELEKSADGKNYTNMAIQFATENKGEQYYNYKMLATERAYFRLKVVNKDKSTFYSNIVYVNYLDEENKISVLPNPATSSLLSFSFQPYEAGVYTISIYNANGVKLLNKQHSLQKGSTTIKINLPDLLPAGVYLLEVLGSNVRTVQRFVYK